MNASHARWGSWAVALLLAACAGAEQGAPAAEDVGLDAKAGDDTPVDQDSGEDAAGPAGDAADTLEPVGPVYPRDGELRLNHLRALGTHNSYHLAPEDPIPEWTYGFDPLDLQLGAQGVRQFELDVHWNPGLGALEVYHVPLLDEGTTCRLLTDCLGALKAWSDVNPGHHPLFVFIEAKDDMAWLFENDEAPQEVSLMDHHHRIDEAIRSVWPADRLLEPAEVQGDAPTLRDAILERGWPTLGEVRDHLVVVFLERGEHRDRYLQAGGSGQGPAMFVVADPGSDDEWPPHAAIFAADDPVKHGAAITAAAQAGFIVRTRADADSAAPDPADAPRLAAALASGAHLLSSDYPVAADNGYVVQIPGGQPSGCNPVSAPADCAAVDIEALRP